MADDDGKSKKDILERIRALRNQIIQERHVHLKPQEEIFNILDESK